MKKDQESSASKSGNEAPTVLLVEDGRVDRAVMRSSLETNGLVVFECESAETAWDFLSQRTVDVVVSDLVMPGRTGIELLQGMRLAAPDVPVVLVTASDRMALAAEAVRQQAFDLLLKPVSEEALLSSVRAALKAESRRRPGRTGRVPPPGDDWTGSLAMEAVMANLPSGLLVIDSAGLLRFSNPAARSILGLTEEAGIGSCYTALRIPKELHSAIRAALGGEFPNGQQVADFHRDDGSQGWIGYSASSLRWPGDASSQGVILHFSDISEKMQLETSLIQADKLATLGTMAGALAHDINNPMTVILGSLELLTEELGTGNPKLTDRLRLVARSSWQCVDIVRNFLKLARSDRESNSPCFVDGVLRDMSALLDGEFISRRIKFHIQIAVGLPPLAIGASKLQQVLMNLFLNARDAMPDGGTLTVTAEMSGNQHVEITVRDSGTGIPEEHLSKIFNTFFSTKAAGEGTGLGLSICRMLVREQGGELEVQSEANFGTTFSIRLPAARAALMGSEERARASQRANEKFDLDVLVVDDEAPTLDLYDRLLSRMGCRSTFFSTPTVAIAEFEPGKYDLALIDLRMPGMDGFELCRQLHRMQPDLPVLFVSGTVLPDSDEKARSCDALGLLGKPFRITELQDWLERVSRAKPPGLLASTPDAAPKPIPIRYRVLVIDDEPDMCQILQMSLQANGPFEVEIATSGEAGIRRAQEEPPDIVLLDLMMPEIDGFETCRRLKTDPLTSGTRVVILSARQGLEDVVKGLQMGADHFLMKPREIGGLARELLEILEPSDRVARVD